GNDRAHAVRRGSPRGEPAPYKGRRGNRCGSAARAGRRQQRFPARLQRNRVEATTQAARPARCQWCRLASRIHGSLNQMNNRNLTHGSIAVLVVGAAVLLAGCANPGGIRPTHTLSDTTALGATTTQPPWPTARWWSEYGDAELDRLVDQALAGQPTLKTAQARLQLAQASVNAAGAARYPRVDGAVDLTDQRFSENGIFPPPLAG